MCNGAGVCGVCVPGAVSECCGLLSEACCTTTTGAAEPEAASPTARQAIIEPVEPIDPILPIRTCCCGSTEICGSTGAWGACD